jgi:NADPH:quinone reductase-like Zn-dependent oxidoreductase
MSAVQSRVIRFHQTGEPLDVLREERAEVADPAVGRIRIRVAAAGLNPADWALCHGFMPGSLPRGIGCDAAGTVDAIGAGVADTAIGDLVFGSVDIAQPSAGAADFAILNRWFAMPDGLDFAEAATLPMVVKTARFTLDAMHVTPGTSILIHGAGGMVGFAAVQVALRTGARVIATAGPTFAPDLERAGALVTSYGDGMAERVRALAGGDVDLVLDTARTAEGTMATLISLAGGDPKRVVTVSNHDEARRLGARVNLDELLATGAFPDDGFLGEYASLCAASEFHIPIARRYPLDEWADAVRLSVSGQPRGKLILIP